MHQNVPAIHHFSFYREIAGLLGLVALLAFFIATSWRKWPDPLIDYGSELYVPWQLSQGAVLYRDIDTLCGPLSQYFDAVLFRVFGPSLMVMVAANFLFFLGILASIYVLFRRAWGIGPALAAEAVFIAVFGFSQLVGTGNYNFATPYNHEVTHGLFICLLLVLVLVRWVENITPGKSFLAGLLFGLTLVLKFDLVLAGGMALGVAGLAAYRLGKRPGVASLGLIGLGAILPTLAFVAFLSAFLPFAQALAGACNAWLILVASTQATGDIQERAFLGLDHPLTHFMAQAVATVMACLLFAAMAGTARALDRIRDESLYYLGLVAVAAVTAGLAFFAVHWMNAGRCLPGLILIYAALCLASLFRAQDFGKDQRVLVVRLLVAVLALAFLARMILNARIYHYGFYEAALAGILVPAVLLGELPARIGVGWKGSVATAVATLALFVPGVAILVFHSQTYLNAKTTVVGTGSDQFYAYSPEIDPTGQIVNAVSETLRQAPPGQTLVVLPEGVMINYLSRLPSPINPYTYFPGPDGDTREDQTVAALKRHPPDWVVIISRDLREFGVERFGEKPGAGQQILNWVHDNYDPVQSIGGDPLDARQRGAVILRRKAPAP